MCTASIRAEMVSVWDPSRSLWRLEKSLIIDCWESEMVMVTSGLKGERMNLKGRWRSAFRYFVVSIRLKVQYKTSHTYNPRDLVNDESPIAEGDQCFCGWAVRKEWSSTGCFYKAGAAGWQCFFLCWMTVKSTECEHVTFHPADNISPQCSNLSKKNWQ